MATPYVTVHLQQVRSTQDEARRRATGSRRPVLVVADRQTGGRGRTGTSWVAAPRAVFASLGTSVGWQPEEAAVIPLMAGLAARTALAGVGRVEMKWPNDLVALGGKVGGVLVERRDELVVIGLGVNLWWPSPIDGTAALLDEAPDGALELELAERWARSLLSRMETGPADWGRDEYAAACVTLGLDVTWEPDGHGRALGVDERGGLVVETGSGIRVVRAGEVRHVRAVG